MGDGIISVYVRHTSSKKRRIKFHVNASYCGRYSVTVSTLSAFCNLSSTQFNSKHVVNSSHITSLLTLAWHWLKITRLAAAIVYIVASRYYASYLSHAVEYINWILITCRLQIIAVFSPEHNFVNTTTVTIATVVVGHGRLLQIVICAHTHIPLKRGWLYVHRSSVCVS
jgi:hypothetical protein